MKKEGKVVFCEVNCVWYSHNALAVKRENNRNAPMGNLLGALTYWNKNDNYRNEKK